MDSPNTPCTMTSHQAIMKCPWQWRQPFLDEKLESRKRKVGDGCFYDPVDPNFVDHLLPGHAKKFCAELLESDEKEKIQMEIERLKLKKEVEDEKLMDNESIFNSLIFTLTQDTPLSDGVESDEEVARENLALVDSILLMSKSVEEATQASSLLASPLSVSSPSDEEDVECGGCSSDEVTSDPSFEMDEVTQTEYVQSPSLELMSDNLQETFITTEDDDILDFTPTTKS